MSSETFEVLRSLCSMWDQYCSDPGGHLCMSAGEGAQQVLDKYSLLKHGEGLSDGQIDWERVRHLEQSIVI